MENQHQKFVNLVFLVAAALVGYVFYSYGMKAAILFEWESKLRSMGVRTPIDGLMPYAALFLATAIGIIFYRNQKVNLYLTDVVNELSRVTWPTQKETTNSTFVVIIMVLISGMVLGFLDFVWTKLLQKIF